MSNSLFRIGARVKPKLQQDSDNYNNSFLRKYQELVKERKASQTKLKPSIFKSQRAISLQNLRAIGSLSRVKTSVPKSSRQKLFISSHKNLRKRAKSASEQESLEISAIHSHSHSNKANTQNPQKNQVQVISKTEQVKSESYQNILLNKKLGMDMNAKNELENHIAKLKKEITKEKNTKFRAIKNVQKMLNHLSDIETMLDKTQKERIHLNEQIRSYQNELFKQTDRNEKLEFVHSRNLKKIRQEKRLIQNFEKHNEQTKASLILENYQLNVAKDNYFIERNRLLKNESKFEQASKEREKICRSVNQNVVKNLAESEIKTCKA